MYPKNISVLLLVMMTSCTIHSSATKKASSRASQSMSRFVRWAESHVPQSVKTTFHDYNPANSNFYKSATSSQTTPQALSPRALKTLNLSSSTVSSESIQIQYQKMLHNISISSLPHDQKTAHIKDLEEARSTLMEQIRSSQQRPNTTPKSSEATPKSAKTPNAKNFYRGYNPYHVAGGIAALTAAAKATSYLPDSDDSRDESAPKGYQTLSEIIETFRALPHNQYFDSHEMDPNKTFSGLGNVGSQEEQATEFIRVMTLWMQNMSSHLRQADWLKANTGETKPSDSFFNIRHVTARFCEPNLKKH